MKRLMILATLLAIGTNNFKNCANKASSDAITTPEMPAEDIKLRKLKKSFVVGNFNGYGIDTLFQYNYSGLSKMEIDSSACPYQNDWETVIHWFINQQANAFLTINKNKSDTLYLGLAQGLYCLINIGDINSDGRDEIALVVDYLDFSRVNSCKIYTLCNAKWVLLKQFGIHEVAFDFLGEEPPIFSEIKGYLEKHDEKWFYLDYNEEILGETENTGKMKLLKQ